MLVAIDAPQKRLSVLMTISQTQRGPRTTHGMIGKGGQLRLCRWLASGLLFVSLGCGTESAVRQVAMDETRGVTMHLRDAEVANTDSVFVTYQGPQDDDRRLVFPASLMLQKDGQDLYQLVVRDKFERDAVIAPDDPIYQLALRAGNEYRFELPKVDAGNYQLCAWFVFTKPGSDPDRGRVCNQLTITT